MRNTQRFEKIMQCLIIIGFFLMLCLPFIYERLVYTSLQNIVAVVKVVDQQETETMIEFMGHKDEIILPDAVVVRIGDYVSVDVSYRSRKNDNYGVEIKIESITYHPSPQYVCRCDQKYISDTQGNIVLTDRLEDATKFSEEYINDELDFVSGVGKLLFLHHIYTYYGDYEFIAVSNN